MEEEIKEEGAKGKHLTILSFPQPKSEKAPKKGREWRGVGRSLSGWENMDHFAAPSKSISLAS